MRDGERLVAVETNVKNIEKKLDEHCKNQRVDFDMLFKKIDGLKGKYAGKWVEAVVTGLVISVIGGVIVWGVILR